MIHDLVNRGTGRELAAGRIEYLVSRRNKPKLQLPVPVRCSRDEIKTFKVISNTEEGEERGRFIVPGAFATVISIMRAG